VIDCIAELMRHETAGDPMSELKWTRKTTEKLASELRALGISVSPNTVGKLLKNMGYSLRVNHKQLSRVCKAAPQDRDSQFRHIAQLRKECVAHGVPLISVDTKKKELVGLFKNAGTAWNQEPVEVNDHDFASDATGKAIPYGIYDVLANRGTIYLGTSIDTAEFAIDAIEAWWTSEGRRRYKGAKRLAILADGGGSNGSSNRLWKLRLYQFAQRHGLAVIVAHYPPGASKWNPIEHRLFSEISKNWAGRPLDSYETILNYIRTTRTKSGLQVRAHLLDREYHKAAKITDAEMRDLSITHHETLHKWNYTLNPDSSRPEPKRGVIAA
jgi:hypothetical protein